MKFEIKSWYDGRILFSIETESWKLAIEAAVKSGADLSGADLYGADLSGADLSGANLSGADLSRASLYGAKGVKDFMNIGRIGSRDDCLVAIKNDKDEIKIIAGCWSGSIDEFEKRVKEVHGKNKHGKNYALAIKLIRQRMDVS